MKTVGVSCGSEEKDFRIIEDSQSVSRRSFSKLVGPMLLERDHYGIYDLLQGQWGPGVLPSGWVPFPAVKAPGA